MKGTHPRLGLQISLREQMMLICHSLEYIMMVVTKKFGLWSVSFCMEVFHLCVPTGLYLLALWVVFF